LIYSLKLSYILQDTSCIYIINDINAYLNGIYHFNQTCITVIQLLVEFIRRNDAQPFGLREVGHSNAYQCLSKCLCQCLFNYTNCYITQINHLHGINTINKYTIFHSQNQYKNTTLRNRTIIISLYIRLIKLILVNNKVYLKFI